MIRWERHIARKGMTGKAEGKRPLGRPRHRWESNIRINVRKIGWEGETGFFWRRVGKNLGSSEEKNEPSNSIRGG
jgi:hypothetical protein